MDVSDIAGLVSGGAVWTGLLFLIVRSIVAVVGTRTERADAENWSRLHDHLEQLASSHERQVDRLLLAYERAVDSLLPYAGERRGQE